MSRDLKYQKKLAKQLHNNELPYDEASIYTILLDLVEGNGVTDIFMLLHNVATDLKKRKKLEGCFEDAKTWKWE